MHVHIVSYASPLPASALILTPISTTGGVCKPNYFTKGIREDLNHLRDCDTLNNESEGARLLCLEIVTIASLPDFDLR